MQKIRSIGIVLVIFGLLFNPWILETLLTPDGKIYNPILFYFIIVVEILLILLGLAIYYKWAWFVKRKKELMLLVISAIIAFIFLEFASHAINLRFNKLDLYNENINTQNKLPELPDWASSYIIHPYLGYIRNPNGPGISKFGFLRQTTRTNANNELYLAVLGGSVAEIFCTKRGDSGGMSILIKILESSIFQNKKIIVDCLANGGWKQPQQLFALNYMLLNGAKYDLVINIDGFNELVKSNGNINDDISIVYPDLWRALAAREYNEEDLQKILKIKKTRRIREYSKKFFSLFPLSRSNTAALIGNILNNYFIKRINILNLRLQETIKNENTGPISDKSLNEQRFEILRIWADSSKFIEGLSKQHGFEYFHFLQPNQYHENSKVLSGQELKTAYREGGNAFIREWYPKMIEVGNNLSMEGVKFYDATMIFQNETRTLYIDTCCHFNDLGNEILAKFIAGKIIDYHKKNSGPPGTSPGLTDTPKGD